MKQPLLFHWPERHHVHLVLPLAIAFAAALHFASFFFFQIAYPHEHSGTIWSAEVFFLPLQSPEAAKLAPVIGASDPALFSPSRPSKRDGWELPETGYTASFDKLKPGFAGWPEPRADKPPLEFWKPAPVASRIRTAPAAGVPQKSPTVIRLGGGLAERTFQVSSPPEYHALPKQSLKPAEFLLAVSGEGKALHVFPIQGSGNEQLDSSSLRALLQGTFSPQPGASAAWGTATFLWGTDVQHAPAP